MERIIAWIFASVLAGAVVSLDYFSKLQTDPGLTFSGYVGQRLEPVRSLSLGGTGRVRPPAATPPLPGEPSDGSVSPARAVVLALGTLGTLGGETVAGKALRGAIPAGFAPDGVLDRTTAIFAATGAPGPEPSAPAPLQDRPRPGRIATGAGTLQSSCTTRAGTKFCQVRKD
ncbi:MAG: hypothetical protein ACOY4T_08850 [Pseudomonadota bacterium]